MEIQTQACLTPEVMLFLLNSNGSDKMQLNLDSTQLLRYAFPNSHGTTELLPRPAKTPQTCFYDPISTLLSNCSFAHLLPLTPGEPDSPLWPPKWLSESQPPDTHTHTPR